MEPVRPEVDDFVLGLLEHRTFRKANFTETADGHVRLLAPLTHELAETMPRWAKSLGPIAEHVAHVLGKAMDGAYAPATPLTSRRHRAAQAVIKARKASAKAAATSSATLQKPMNADALPLWTCRDCGGAVTNPRHVRCDACIAVDPAHSPEIRGRRGAAIAARKRALSDWDKANPDVVYDPELFRREILPRLADVKLMDIAKAASCCKASASDIRRGKWEPHVSTWGSLAAVCGVTFLEGD
jgi:rubrerythrin